jgi:hypothetical protein
LEDENIIFKRRGGHGLSFHVKYKDSDGIHTRTREEIDKNAIVTSEFHEMWDLMRKYWNGEE